MDHTESVPMEYVTCIPSKPAGHYHVWTIPNQSQWNMLHVYPLNQLDTVMYGPYRISPNGICYMYTLLTSWTLSCMDHTESVPMECVTCIPSKPAGHYHVCTIPNQSQWNMLHVYPLNKLDTIMYGPYRISPNGICYMYTL
mgnify:CR=1 FL=1